MKILAQHLILHGVLAGFPPMPDDRRSDVERAFYLDEEGSGVGRGNRLVFQRGNGAGDGSADGYGFGAGDGGRVVRYFGEGKTDDDRP